MGNYELDMEKYALLARQAIAEGCVLLENEGHALPLKKGDKAAVYGRSAFNYYKSGLGSGGSVNTRYTVSILDALRADKDIELNAELLGIYEDWIDKNPYDDGEGWGKVPLSQKEMPLNDRMLEIAEEADVSLIIIGRTAGEDQDNKAAKGSFLLTEEEEKLLEGVCAVSKRSVVILNVGNIIDMSWVARYSPKAVIYVWQGGQEGGNGTLDALTGKINPCGKLTDTIAENIDCYPSTANFGDPVRNFYAEDIYVGYRYFETFARKQVLYPFGYGLSYTRFDVSGTLAEVSEVSCIVKARVRNIGECAGKETLQVYVSPPQGKLGNPLRRLTAFHKTGALEPGEEEEITFVIKKSELASYDDSGVTGAKHCFVLEEGNYEFYVGTDVRSAGFAGAFHQNFEITERLSGACAPVRAFERIKPCRSSGAGEDAGAEFDVSKEAAPLRESGVDNAYKEGITELAYTGDKGYKLVDVLDNKVTIEEFTAQLDDKDLVHIFRGEGMCSPRVTPGTASAFGGVTERLSDLGIPAACCSDGPSGIRMDCGSKAFLLPSGTALASTFNPELVEELYEMLGRELRLNKIDVLLGPGMNIHRNPLNGRNFEYISEDPYLTGKIAAAQIKGMDRVGIAGTIKHFCANNQEEERRIVDSVVSERALREIYLKGFEIAVKEGGARSLMTTYAPLNGIWTAGSYDLCTRILRKEWGFEGIVMSDWWAQANYEGKDCALEVKAPMAAAQNDLYMCVSDSGKNPENDDMESALETGYLTRGMLQRNAVNILKFILKTPALLRAQGRLSKEELNAQREHAGNTEAPENLKYYRPDKKTREFVIDGSEFHPKGGDSDSFGIIIEETGDYQISLELCSGLGALAQLPLSIFVGGLLKASVSIRGTEGGSVVEERNLGGLTGGINYYIRLYYGANGIEIKKAIIRKL